MINFFDQVGVTHDNLRARINDFTDITLGMSDEIEISETQKGIYRVSIKDTPFRLAYLKRLDIAFEKLEDQSYDIIGSGQIELMPLYQLFIKQNVYCPQTTLFNSTSSHIPHSLLLQSLHTLVTARSTKKQRLRINKSISTIVDGLNRQYHDTFKFTRDQDTDAYYNFGLRGKKLFYFDPQIVNISLVN